MSHCEADDRAKELFGPQAVATLIGRKSWTSNGHYVKSGPRYRIRLMKGTYMSLPNNGQARGFREIGYGKSWEEALEMAKEAP